jgi:hypothetical protein
VRGKHSSFSWPVISAFVGPFLILCAGCCGYGGWIVVSAINEPDITPEEAEALALIAQAEDFAEPFMGGRRTPGVVNNPTVVHNKKQTAFVKIPGNPKTHYVYYKKVAQEWQATRVATDDDELWLRPVP